jgi:hypothetical protein
MSGAQDGVRLGEYPLGPMSVSGPGFAYSSDETARSENL